MQDNIIKVAIRYKDKRILISYAIENSKDGTSLTKDIKCSTKIDAIEAMDETIKKLIGEYL